MKGVDSASKYHLHKGVSEPRSGVGLGALGRVRVRVKLVKYGLAPNIQEYKSNKEEATNA